MNYKPVVEEIFGWLRSLTYPFAPDKNTRPRYNDLCIRTTETVVTFCYIGYRKDELTFDEFNQEVVAWMNEIKAILAAETDDTTEECVLCKTLLEIVSTKMKLEALKNMYCS